MSWFRSQQAPHWKHQRSLTLPLVATVLAGPLVSRTYLIESERMNRTIHVNVRAKVSLSGSGSSCSLSQESLCIAHLVTITARVDLQGASTAIWSHKSQGTQSVLEVVEDFCGLFCLPSSTCQIYLEGKLLPRDKFLGKVGFAISLKHVFKTSQHLDTASAGLATCCCHLSACS